MSLYWRNFKSGLDFADGEVKRVESGEWSQNRKAVLRERWKFAFGEFLFIITRVREGKLYHIFILSDKWFLITA